MKLKGPGTPTVLANSSSVARSNLGSRERETNLTAVAKFGKEESTLQEKNKGSWALPVARPQVNGDRPINFGDLEALLCPPRAHKRMRRPFTRQI